MNQQTDTFFPLDIGVIYGADMDPSIEPAVFTLPSAAAFSAFVQGNNEADGWMDAEFLAHGNFRVNANGDIREGKAPAKPALPNERFVLWGDKPDQGAKPQRYVLEDEQCAQAFEDAVKARVGWTASSFVPGSDFRAYRDLEHALESVDATVAKSLQAVVDLDEESLGQFDPIFINPKGAFVQEHWEPGEVVCNGHDDVTVEAKPLRRGPSTPS